MARRLDEIFVELEEKPRIEACRVGTKTPGKIRPVKVSLSNSVMTQKILSKSSRLKRSETFNTVYFAPDRTAVQRREYKKLVEERKKLVSRDPEKHNAIKNGKVVSVARKSN